MYIHGTKYLVLKNKKTGKLENIRSNHNYDEADRKKEERRLKKEWSKGDYICIACNLS